MGLKYKQLAFLSLPLTPFFSLSPSFSLAPSLSLSPPLSLSYLSLSLFYFFFVSIELLVDLLVDLRHLPLPVPHPSFNPHQYGLSNLIYRLVPSDCFCSLSLRGRPFHFPFSMALPSSLLPPCDTFVFSFSSPALDILRSAGSILVQVSFPPHPTT